MSRSRSNHRHADRATSLAASLLATVGLAALVVGCVPDGDFLVVHHRANGCLGDAPENALSGVRCVIEGCLAGTAPCALEGDARVIRVEGGSLGGDAEIVWLHDGSTERTASCPGGDLALPGGAPVSAERLAQCRLRQIDGGSTEEPIPTLDEVLDTVRGTPVTLFLELKGASDGDLDRLLGQETAIRVASRDMIAQTIVTSFEPGLLRHVQDTEPALETACFTPTGQGADQVLTVLAGGILSDVDDCLRAGHDWVFVPPWALDGDVVQHIKGRGVGLGVYGADTADGYDQVQRWRHRVDVVYADHPSMYGE